MTSSQRRQYFGITARDCDAAGARGQVPAQRGAEATRRATPVPFLCNSPVAGKTRQEQEDNRRGAHSMDSYQLIRPYVSWYSPARGELRVVATWHACGARNYAQGRMACKAVCLSMHKAP
jgi:hypothetical protein